MSDIAEDSPCKLSEDIDEGLLGNRVDFNNRNSHTRTNMDQKIKDFEPLNPKALNQRRNSMGPQVSFGLGNPGTKSTPKIATLNLDVIKSKNLESISTMISPKLHSSKASDYFGY